MIPKKTKTIYAELANKYHLPYQVVEVICNHPFRFANAKISDPDNKRTIMFGYLFKIKPKKTYLENEVDRTECGDTDEVEQ